MKPYQQIPILECGEPLVPLPITLERIQPHPYQALGAPYGDASPFQLRSGVVARLELAQQRLQPQGLGLQIFDGYRPLTVQQFMVTWTFQDLVRQYPTRPVADLYREVERFWAAPSLDPAAPPPHSTGGAVDLTLVTITGPVPMGSPIDEVSARSYPDYFQGQPVPFQANREQLNQAMIQAGFQRHPHEWWHFSYGDQLWAWLAGEPTAHYGRVAI
ncbi:M15 family metallopeptidase [Candidatus Cyanaurora vandensis]|uniref:M15 family metallopeptidase n=1 Tax=Candidatus Cyanaurora vandensis TaxID=2714958 RepID=UPI00257AAB73|nr:M15 family metallopeptidase [Candidatus Cyanaurora vandensis]